MNPNNEHVYFNCEVLQNTEKSFKVWLASTGENHIVPKSLCEVTPKGPRQVIEVEEWFAKKEGMVA